jgi:hypothetical protein
MLLAVVIITVIIIFLGMLITNEKYIMTLGDYGKPNPKSCDEVTPKNGMCNACSLECGIFKYKKNCCECTNFSNNI